MTVLLIFAVVALVGVDQIVKYWAVNTLQPKGSIDFIHIGKFEILDLTYVENDGAVFGIMSGQKWFLTIFPLIIIIIGFVLLIKYRERSKLLTWAIVLFIAGGIGNIIDRFRYGYVVDMFEIKLFDFAVFNVADICVTFAVVMILIYSIFIDPKIQKKIEAETSKAENNE